MKNNKIIYTLIAIIIILLIGTVAFLSFSYSDLAKQYKSLNDDYSALNDEFLKFRQDSEASVAELNKKLSEEKEEKGAVESALSETKTQQEELSKKHENLKTEVRKTLDKIKVYKQDIETSMKWFNDNAEITDKNIKYYLSPNSCFRMGTKTCRIKTGCFYFVNSERLGYEYKYDTMTSNANDKMQSIQDFMKNKGGDCEDYSLFYKAEFNYVLNQCLETGADNIIIEGWMPSKYEEDRYFVEFSNNWFLTGATDKIIPAGFIHPNIVCGNLYDFSKKDAGGHCVIAFTKNRIKSIKDIDELNNAPMIEPQNGLYLGLINEESSKTYILTKENYDTTYSYINLIVTDEDQFLFSDQHKEWLGYSIFKDDMEKNRKLLAGMLK
ncbi:MAG: hypothetical protein ABIG89_04050 [Candidatus Woesearchaeota archaeon]